MEGCKIGIDLGGTTICVVMADSLGKIVGGPVEVLTHRERTPKEILGTIVAALEQVLETAGLRWEGVDGVGIGVPTTLDGHGGLMASPNLPTMTGVRIGQELENALGRSVVLENDANCFAYGEWHAGAGKGMSVCCGVTLGTGLGMGIVMDGRIYRGSRGGAGEIWCSPYPDQRRVEEVVSGPGAEMLYRERTGRTVRAAEVAERARESEGGAIEVWRVFGEALGFALSYVVNVLDPEVIVIGGSVGTAYDLFAVPMMSVLERQAHDPQTIRIVPSSMGKVAGALGAALCT